MADSPFAFLRATFYRWVQLWPKVCPELANAALVLGVGDLHVENFGTWRDSEGRLIDNDVTREIDNARMDWAMDDLILNRPPLSRWHPDYAHAFAAFLAERTGRRG